MKKHKKHIIMLMVICAALFSGCDIPSSITYNLHEDAQADSELSESSSELSEDMSADSISEEESDEHVTQEAEMIKVYVCGAVFHEGVYELPAGSRVADAISLAGGMLEDADTKGLNQAKVLSDGEQIIVYTLEEILSGASSRISGDAMSKGSGKVNLNTANLEELKTLVGIGDARAEAILQYRESQGGFASVDELLQVDGIKEGIFEKIKDKVEV